ncbi:hypothetical protein RAN53_12395 [Halomonas sp. SSL-5]|uniref:hypothetical protein n=1 Tax=Halomonas sp. SSL-5 TaxID=3065855 RepID=UPI00273A0B02|nr:hypothetical protein [Halomonas sp. SSL-5]MDY7117146.1 hypothetical protein [Halomonas sp. SSL-5]
MALDRRTVLAAIAAETADRAGPMPVWLVEVAANAKTRPERDFVATELIALRQAQLIECHRQNGASGVSLTEAGRAELRELNQGKRQPSSLHSAPSSLHCDPSSAPSSLHSDTGSPHSPPMPDAPVGAPMGESQVKTPPAPDAGPLPDLERLDPELQPRLCALMIELGQVLVEDLATATEARDLRRAQRLNDLARRVLRHTRRPS